jgi:hypothetical protein
MSDFYESATNLNPQEQSEENKLVNIALTKFPVPHLSGLKLRADIKLGNLVLNTIDDDNVIWVCTDIEGWWNLPDPELPDLPRGWGDGSYDAKGRWASRILTLNGTFLTQDPSQVEAARAKLLDAVSLVYRGDWLVVDETPVKKGTFVRLSGRPEISTVTARGRTDFSIGLKAADPTKYEYIEENSDGYNIVTLTADSNGDASTTITNAGNIAVPIIIELSKGFNVSTPGPDAGATLIPIAFYQRTEGAITLQFASDPPFNDGDTVYLDNVHPTMDGYQVVNVVDGDILQIISPGANIPVAPAGSGASISASSGPIQATITNATSDQAITITDGTSSTNQLEIDTYNREVLDVEYLGDQVVNVENGRAKVSILIDWIYLNPGSNAVELTNFPTGSTCKIYYRSGWIG